MDGELVASGSNLTNETRNVRSSPPAQQYCKSITPTKYRLESAVMLAGYPACRDGCDQRDPGVTAAWSSWRVSL